MADLVSLIGPVLSGIAGVGAGAYAHRASTRSAARTAARLIHAELVENAGYVRYYRAAGEWPEGSNLRHAAWDANSAALAKMRRVSAFQAINRGYSALERIPMVAKSLGDSHDAEVESLLQQALNDAIDELVGALSAAGEVALVESWEVRRQIEDLIPEEHDANGDGIAGEDGLLERRLRAVALIAPQNLDQIVHHGTEQQQKAASETVDKTKALAAEETAGSPPLAKKPTSTRRRRRAAPAAAGRLQRRIHDAKNKGDYVNAVLVRSEGDPPTGDQAVDEVYEGLGVAHTFFLEVYKRPAIGKRGRPLQAVVHYLKDFLTAFWDGQRVVFGDGDGKLFLPFTRSLDVIGRMASYSVIQQDAKLVYEGQSGALMVSSADVFGTLIKQYSLRQTAEAADWLIGVEVLGHEVKGAAMGSLKEPGTAYDDEVFGKDPQPAHMDGFVQTDADLGGVHVNSGIPSHAFYLVAVSLGGFAWDRAGRIWYETLRDPELPQRADFKAFARATAAAAGRLYGARSAERSAVVDAWRAVGIAPAGRARKRATTTKQPAKAR